ncbi:MAG TPA: CpaF family protein [Candidatus Dormibacteraeota bacterium]|nr:CpaF family protein [Candidatus Dormibacteraeota bacterium]
MAPTSGDDPKPAAPAPDARPAPATRSQQEPPTFQLPQAPDDPPALSGWQVRHAPPAQRPAEPAKATQPARPDGPGTAPGFAPRPLAATAPAPSPPATAPAPATGNTPVPLRPRPAPPLMMRSGSGESGDAAPRQSSLLNRTALARGPLSKPGGNNLYAQLRSKVHQRLVEELAGNASTAPPEQVRQRIGELVNELVAEQNLSMTRQDKLRVVETVIDDALGLGPLEGLLNDPEVTEIMINKHNQIYVEQHGKLSLSTVTFDSNEQLMQVIDRIVSSIGRRVDESSPMVDARLKDGSRVNVIIPPLALRGPTLTIRKFAKEAFTVDDLVNFGTITEDMVRFLRACVRGRLNVIVSGGTGSGKTTTLNLLSSFIPEDERIVTIEDAAELQLRQEHVVTLETRPANIEGRGRVTIRELVINSLRMRPDRIVIGECRGGEALDMLQAMNTGHDGSLTTLHANNAKECIGRLETLVLMAGAELPSRAIREQIGSAVNIIVQQSRMRDGTRKVVSITEVLGTDGEHVVLQEIFAFRQTGLGEDGQVLGGFAPTGVVPHFLDHLEAEGEGVPVEIFQGLQVVGQG